MLACKENKKAELHDRKQIVKGYFEEKCHEQSVSPILLSFMHMLTRIESKNDEQSLKLSPALVLSQLLTFNSAIGLTKNDAALARWLLAGPEISRMAEEFEDSNSLSELDNVLEHHDFSERAQQHFSADVREMYDALAEFGKPFMDDSTELYALDTKILPGKEAIANLYSVKVNGKEQLVNYMNSHIRFKR